MSKTHEEKKQNNHRIYMSTMRKIRKTSSVIISNQHILQDKPINNNLQSKMQSNEQIHYLNEDREYIDNIQSSSDDSSSDNNEPESEPKLLNFKDDFIETAFSTSMNATQITAMLQFFNRHNIGQPMPLSSRTLLKTPRYLKIRQVSNVEYYNFGVENQIIQNLTTNYDDFINDQIYLTLNIDGIPFYKASKESCWPILLCCNIEPHC